VFELAALIKKDKERVRFEQLTFRDKKIFEDISQLLVNVEAMKVEKNKKGSGSKKILQSTYQSGAMSTL
jgi:hypothetical protein